MSNSLHILKSEWKNIGYQVELLFRLSNCSYQIGNINEAEKHLKKAFAIKDDRVENDEIEGPVTDYQDILSKMRILRNKIKDSKNPEK